jgi:hypothetical protein
VLCAAETLSHVLGRRHILVHCNLKEDVRGFTLLKRLVSMADVPWHDLQTAAKASISVFTFVIRR